MAPSEALQYKDLDQVSYFWSLLELQPEMMHFQSCFFMQSCRTGIHQVLKLISDFSHALTPHSLSHIIIINKRHIRVKRHPVFCLLNAFAFSDMGVICPMLLSSLHPLSLSLSRDGELCCCGRVDTKPLREWKE